MLKELEYPFDSEFILKKSKSLKRQLLSDGSRRIKKNIAVLGGSTTPVSYTHLDVYKRQKEFYPMQPGDVYQTFADVSELVKDFDYKPSTSIEEGLGNFADWYRKWTHR